MTSCGVPGCTRPKLTPGGNKNFACKFWQLQSRKKLEEESIKISENEDRKLRAMKGRLDLPSVLKAGNETQHSKDDNDLVVEPTMVNFYTPKRENLPTADKPVVQPPQKLSEPELFDLEEEESDDQFDSLVSRINKLDCPRLFDAQAQSQIRKIERILKEAMPTILKNAVYSNPYAHCGEKTIEQYQEEYRNQDAEEILRLRDTVDFQEKAIRILLMNQDKLQEQISTIKSMLEKTINQVYDGPQSVNDWEIVKPMVRDKYFIDFPNVIRYSKYIKRRYHEGMNCGKPNFLISREVDLNYHLWKHYPNVFEAFDDLDYLNPEKDPNKKKYDSTYYKKNPLIYIVPDISYIPDDVYDRNRLLYVDDNFFQSKEKDKIADRVITSFAYVEFYIMLKLSDWNITYDFEEYKNLYVHDIQQKLENYKVKNLNGKEGIVYFETKRIT